MKKMLLILTFSVLAFKGKTFAQQKPDKAVIFAGNSGSIKIAPGKGLIGKNLLLFFARLILNNYRDSLIKLLVDEKPQRQLTSETAYTATDTSKLLKKISNNLEDPFFAPAPMEINLVNFAAAQQDDVNHLTWGTSDEISVGGFMVEKSSDGVYYYAIGSVEAANLFSVKNYRFTDSLSAEDRHANYYRLRIVSLLGDIVYSSAIQVNNTAAGLTGAGYNLDKTTGMLLINTPLPVKKLEILDETASLVYSAKHFNLLQPIPTETFGKGVYTIRILYNNKVVSQLFFRK